MEKRKELIDKIDTMIAQTAIVDVAGDEFTLNVEDGIADAAEVVEVDCVKCVGGKTSYIDIHSNVSVTVKDGALITTNVVVGATEDEMKLYNALDSKGYIKPYYKREIVDGEYVLKAYDTNTNDYTAEPDFV